MRSETPSASLARPNGHGHFSPPEPDALELLNVAEVAKLIHQSQSWVRSQCRQRAKDRMPHIKKGGRLFFEESVVLAWFRSSEIAYPNRKR